MKEILLETNQANSYGLETCNSELGNESAWSRMPVGP